MIYGYGRVSTKGQAKDGNSLEAQERLLKEHGAEVIYMDSFTGTKMTRPEFDKLLEELKAGDTLVVAKLDRFARSVSQASDLITKLIDNGIVYSDRSVPLARCFRASLTEGENHLHGG